MMLNALNFIGINIVLPVALSVLYARFPKKYKFNYDVTKAIWYLCYAAVVSYDYLVHNAQRYIAGFTVTIAIMEGVPLLLFPLFSAGKDKTNQAGE